MSKVFEPKTVINISASTTSAETTAMDSTENIIRVANLTSAVAYVRWGTSAQTAVTTDMAIPAGAVECFTKSNATRLAVILASGTGTVQVTTGTGQ